MEANIKARSEAVQKYFTPTPTPEPIRPSFTGDITLITIGLFLFMVGIIWLSSTTKSLKSVDSEMAILASGFALGFIFLMLGWLGWSYKKSAYDGKKSVYDSAFAKAEPKPSDSQMEAWLNEDKSRIINDGMRKLGLIPEQILNPNPIVIIGPLEGAKIAEGKTDGFVMFSGYRVVVVYLTNFHLGAYTCHLNFYDGSITNEETQEYHYIDIVSVATLTVNSEFIVETTDGKKHPIATQQQFSLSVASSESIRVTVAFPQIPGIIKTGRLLPSESEKAIGIIRAMLREKKGGLPHG